MKRIHLLKTDLTTEQATPLIQAAHVLGLRIGRLAWRPGTEPEPTESEPPSWSPQPWAEAGVLRAVSVEKGRTVSIKPMAGPPVLRDVIREHFRGCVAVLVELDDPSDQEPNDQESDALAAAPRLSADGMHYVVETAGADGEPRRLVLEADDLARRLRRPDPFTD